MAGFWIGVNSARVMLCSGVPHQPSKGSSTVLRPGWRSVTRKAPVPLALRVAKFSESLAGRSAPLAAAQPESMIIQLAMESGKIGLGALV